MIEAQPQPPSKSNPDLPSWLGKLIQKLLSKAPDKRPESAQHVVDTIDKHSQRPQPSKSRRRLLIAAAALVTAVLMIGLWPEPVPKPFQLNSNGKVYPTLTDTLRSAKAKDIIEVVDPLTRITEAIDFGDKAITIRSSNPDLNPILDFTPQSANPDGANPNPNPDSANLSPAPSIRAQSDLTLEGVTLRRQKLK
ncbi:MAG: hypothetical protein AAF404_04450, partial [Pseudomonadota bacterium]